MPTPRPIIIPSSIVSSGTVATRVSSTIEPMPMPTPPSATAMGRPMASTDPNATMSTIDGEGDADQLGLRAARPTPGTDRRPAPRAHRCDGASVGDQLADPAGLGVVDVGRQVHLGERRAGRPAGPSVAIWPAPWLDVGRDDGRARGLRHPGVVGEAGVDGGEELLHGGDDLGVVDALVGPEHDGAGLAAGAELGEVLLEHGEPGGAVGAGHRRAAAERRTDRAGGREDHHEDDDPERRRSLAGGRSTSRRAGRGRCRRSAAARPRRSGSRRG